MMQDDIKIAFVTASSDVSRNAGELRSVEHIKSCKNVYYMFE